MGVGILAAALVLSVSPLADSFSHDEADDHHEHGGVSDATSPNHTHGDADDHHETPDSPCHHHVLHCCCAHTHAVATELPEEVTHELVDQRASLPAGDPGDSISIRAIFHVPRA